MVPGDHLVHCALDEYGPVLSVTVLTSGLAFQYEDRDSFQVPGRDPNIGPNAEKTMLCHNDACSDCESCCHPAGSE